MATAGCRPQEQICGSHSTLCPPGALQPFLQSCFPIIQTPACSWGCLVFHCSTEVGLGIYFLSFMSGDSHWPTQQPLKILLNVSAATWCINCFSCVNMPRVHYIPSSWLLGTMLKTTGLTSNLWIKELVMRLQLAFTHMTPTHLLSTVLLSHWSVSHCQ